VALLIKLAESFPPYKWQGNSSRKLSKRVVTQIIFFLPVLVYFCIIRASMIEWSVDDDSVRVWEEVDAT